MHKPNLRMIQFTVQLSFFLILISLAVIFTIRNLYTAPRLSDAPLASTTLVSNKPNVPVANSFKFGLFTDSPNVTNDEKKIDYRLNLVGWFVHWNEAMDSHKLQTTCQEGYVPEITWESWDGTVQGSIDNPYPLANIAHGDYDTLIRQQLEAVKSVCKNQTVIIRFDHEMDTPYGVVSYYPWQGDPVAYDAAWRHVVTLSRSIDPNVKWLWSPNRGTLQTEAYYPGSQWVDYVGLTMDRGTLEQQIPTFATFYQQNQTVIESFEKPIIISETTDDESLPGGSKAQWVSGMFDFLKQNPQITALVWFNGSPTPTYKYDSSAASLNAFVQGLQSMQGKDK